MKNPYLVVIDVQEKLFPIMHEKETFLKNIQTSISYFKNLEFSDGVVLAGIETHVCVYQTERDLIHRGQHVEVVTDAVTSRIPNNHKIALDRIRNNGGYLTTVEMLLFSLQEIAEGDRFRELIKLVK